MVDQELLLKNLYKKMELASLYFHDLVSSTALIDDYHKTLLDRSDFGKFTLVKGSKIQLN